MFGVARRACPALAALAAALILSACGQDAPDQTAGGADLSVDPDIVSETLFAKTCMDLNGDEGVCACVRGQVAAQSGVEGLGYIGAAYGSEPELAAPYEAEMTQAERNEAGEAFLNAQFDCVIAADPDYAAAADTAPGDADADGAPASESPLERAVAACIEAGAAPEPVCRCRADHLADALGEAGLELARAAEAGDENALRALALELGEPWLATGRDALEDARAACPA